jgi:hypothetical protein
MSWKRSAKARWYWEVEEVEAEEVEAEKEGRRSRRSRQEIEGSRSEPHWHRVTCE